MIRRLIILLLIVGCENSTEPVEDDCAGVVGGTASLDNCNVCDNDSINDNTTCSQDCAGVWGGDAEACSVAWVVAQDSIITSNGVIISPRIFWTGGYKPTEIDTLYYCNANMSFDTPIGSYNDCIEHCEALNNAQSWDSFFIPIPCSTFPPYESYSFQGYTTTQVDSVNSITHIVEPNIFVVVESNEDSRILIPEEHYMYFQYEYK